MRGFSITRKKIALGSAVAVMAAGGVVAYAYFTSTGSGSGSALTGTSAPLDIAQVGSTSGLIPNGPAQTITYEVTNNTAAAEYVNQVTVTASSLSGAGTAASIEACSTSMYAIVQGPALAVDLQPGHHADGTATIQLVDDGNNQDNCQGATVNLSFSSN